MIDWLNNTTINLLGKNNINGKKLLILGDSDVESLFYCLPIITRLIQNASEITLCCPTTCAKILEKTFEKYGKINIITANNSLFNLIRDESYDFITSTSRLNHPYGYNPILAYPVHSIYHEKIEDQPINQIICGISVQQNIRNNNACLLSESDMYELFYQLNRHCDLFKYDYDNVASYDDYCIGKIFFNPYDIIDLTASYISMSNIIIAYDNLIASMAIAMGKYVIIIHNDEYTKLLTINHPNVTIINAQDNDNIITEVVNQFLKYQQQALKHKFQHKQTLIKQSQQTDKDGKYVVIKQLANECLFDKIIDVISQIPASQRTNDDLDILAHYAMTTKNYQHAYTAFEQKLKLTHLTLVELNQMCLCVQKLTNYNEFAELVLNQYDMKFPDIHQLNDNGIAYYLIIAFATENINDALYYSDYLLQHNPSYLDMICKKNKLVRFKLVLHYLKNNNFNKAWLIHKKMAASYHHLSNDIDIPYWDNDDIKNKKLLIMFHENLGDIIFHISMNYNYLKNIKNVGLLGNFLYFLPLIKRTLPNVKIINHSQDINKFYDFKIYINDLPRLFNITEPTKSFNILKINHRKYTQYRKRLEKQASNKKIIGVSHYSRSHISIHKKCCSLDLWQPILQIENVIFVNLQYGARAYDLDIKAKELGIDLIHWDKPDKSKDFDSFTALVGAMDIIITVNNTLVHQASAISIPCYVMLPKNNVNWYFASKNEKSYWYESLIIMRQNDDEDDWQGVIERTKNHIEANHL